MVTEKMIEAFGQAFWPVNAATHIDGERDNIRAALEAALSTDAEPVGWFNPWNDYHGYQQVAKEFEGTPGKIPLYAAPPAPSVAVKALDWKAHDDGMNHIAIGAFGMDVAYVATSEGWRRFSEKWVALDGLDASKAAAQADYAARIRSALSAQVQDVAEPKRTWQGWDKDNPQEHQDKVCHALFSSEWWENDEKTLVAFIDRAFSAAKLEEKP